MAKKQRASRVGTRAGGRRKHRPRLMPKWLRSAQLDVIARSRCLMVLSVLSGETPVTDAIAQAKISRGTYYQMETRALEAMLEALNPLAASSQGGRPDLSTAAARIEELEAKVKRLEQDKRRTKRLLLLSSKALWRRVKPKNALLGSMPRGRPRSRASKAKAIAGEASIPTRAGETVP